MSQRAPFPLWEQVPRSLRDVILDFHWDIDLLHSLDLPTGTVGTFDLEWHLRLPFWSGNGAPFQVIPREVAADPACHPRQWQRTQAADLRHPVDAYLRADGRIVILDGVHRLLKASLRDQSHLAVRILEPGRFDEIAVVAPLA